MHRRYYNHENSRKRKLNKIYKQRTGQGRSKDSYNRLQIKTETKKSGEDEKV
jgi:hypothetical protein